MKTIFQFMRCIFGMKSPWPVWVGLLLALNMIVPLFFIETPEAKAILISAFAGAGLMMLLFNKYGFVRLLGLGHIFWIPIVIWLGYRLPEFSFSTPLEIWFLLIVGVNTISLILDAIDVVRYFNGDRDPMVTS